MSLYIKKIVVFTLISLVVSGCDVPESKKQAARDAVINEHLDEILESFKKRVEEGKFIAMPDLQRSIEMRECDHLIDLHEDNIS